jgi:hypothetical protein
VKVDRGLITWFKLLNPHTLLLSGRNVKTLLRIAGQLHPLSRPQAIQRAGLGGSRDCNLENFLVGYADPQFQLPKNGLSPQDPLHRFSILLCPLNVKDNRLV